MQQNLEIISRAVKNLELATGIKVAISGSKEILLQLKTGTTTWAFTTEVTPAINAAIIGQLKQKILDHPYTPVLITPYVTPATAKLLRISQVNFLDTAGNAFVHDAPLYIDIRGNKPVELPHKARRLYQSSGLKIVFSLLCNPGLENDDYRKIASMTNVALGSVAWVLRDLKTGGFLIDLGKNRRTLIKKEELLRNWVVNYHEQLKPKLHIGRYAALDKNWLKNILMQENTLWGSEYAAKTMTKYLNPEKYTIYMDTLDPEFLIKNKLHRTPEGPIEILQKFWSFNDTWTKQKLVPPLLVYADLIASQSDRNIETAKLIYNNEIASLIR